MELCSTINSLGERVVEGNPITRFVLFPKALLRYPVV